ncbi:hypothetical protein RSSE_c3281 [Ralstonia solanacearum]|nr:hypothetical protein RSSE_c3281 [Ralstonia solanacearum]
MECLGCAHARHLVTGHEMRLLIGINTAGGVSKRDCAHCEAMNQYAVSSKLPAL